MKEIILTLAVALLGSTGLSTVILACLNRHWQKKDKAKQGDPRIDALVTAQKVTMIDRVRWLGGHYIDNGYITLDDKENLKDMHEAYKALGGNGHLDTVIAEVEKLPVVSTHE